MANGGKRPGAGRKKGKKTQKVLEREAVLEAYRQRALVHAQRLLTAQLYLANGVTMLYKIEKEWVPQGSTKTGTPKGYYRKLKPVLVTNQAEIEDYLLGLTNEGDPQDDQDPGAAYYFLATKPPEEGAINDILDRTFGRAVQSTKIVDDQGKSLPITSINVVPVK